MRNTRNVLFFVPFFLVLAAVTCAQNQGAGNSAVPPLSHPLVEVSPLVALLQHVEEVHLKHLLVISQTNGWDHDSILEGMAAIYNVGHDSGLRETTVRTDAELITKKDIGRNAKNLNYFDALVLVGATDELDLDDSQKQDMMSFIKDDGKGFVGVNVAPDTNPKWPEYGELIGGGFDQHPWFTFEAPVINEDPSFPAVRHYPEAFVKYDKIYQPKEWSRDKHNFLLSLDPAKLDYEAPNIHWTDHNFAVVWPKNYGKGRVFYSSLGHTRESWDDPDIRTMYFEAIKWVPGMTDGSTTPHPRPQESGGHQRLLKAR